MNETIYFSKVKPNAIIPSKLEENAGYDVYACFEEEVMVIPPHTTVIVPTGIASAFSPEFYFQLEERGSTGTKGIAQRCGVIDSGYRNEWGAPLTNTTDKTLWIDKRFTKTEEYDRYIHYPYSKAICQAVFLPVPKTEIIETDYESLKAMESVRGMGCLGSSGK